MFSGPRNSLLNFRLNNEHFAKDAYNYIRNEIDNMQNKDVRGTLKIIDKLKESIYSGRK